MEPNPKGLLIHERKTAEIIPFPRTLKEYSSQERIVVTEEIDVLLCSECQTNSFYVTPEKTVHCMSCLHELHLHPEK